MPIIACDFALSIISNDVELTPHGIEVDKKARVATAYVASTAGQVRASNIQPTYITHTTDIYQNFSLRIDRMGTRRNPLCVNVHVDGACIASLGIESETISGSCAGMWTSPTTIAPLAFSTYTLVGESTCYRRRVGADLMRNFSFPDEDDATATRDTQDLGTMCVKVYESMYSAKKHRSAAIHQANDHSRVVETTKKAGGHRVVYESNRLTTFCIFTRLSRANHAEAKTQERRITAVLSVDEKKAVPQCTFKIMYQPQGHFVPSAMFLASISIFHSEVLRAKGVIPWPAPQRPSGPDAQFKKREVALKISAEPNLDTRKRMLSSSSAQNRPSPAERPPKQPRLMPFERHRTKHLVYPTNPARQTNLAHAMKSVSGRYASN